MSKDGKGDYEKNKKVRTVKRKDWNPEKEKLKGAERRGAGGSHVRTEDGNVKIQDD